MWLHGLCSGVKVLLGQRHAGEPQFYHLPAGLRRASYYFEYLVPSNESMHNLTEDRLCTSIDMCFRDERITIQVPVSAGFWDTDALKHTIRT